jgi:hypothetical protein
VAATSLLACFELGHWAGDVLSCVLNWETFSPVFRTGCLLPAWYCENVGIVGLPAAGPHLNCLLATWLCCVCHVLAILAVQTWQQLVCGRQAGRCAWLLCSPVLQATAVARTRLLYLFVHTRLYMNTALCCGMHLSPPPASVTALAASSHIVEAV